MVLVKNGLELLGSETAEATKLDVIGHTISHHDDERLDLSVSNQVIHDEVGVSLCTPSGFILTPSMLQIQNGEFLLLVLTV